MPVCCRQEDEGEQILAALSSAFGIQNAKQLIKGPSWAEMTSSSRTRRSVQLYCFISLGTITSGLFFQKGSVFMPRSESKPHQHIFSSCCKFFNLTWRLMTENFFFLCFLGWVCKSICRYPFLSSREKSFNGYFFIIINTHLPNLRITFHKKEYYSEFCD